jgi:COP9 signalosome complex subunit 4
MATNLDDVKRNATSMVGSADGEGLKKLVRDLLGENGNDAVASPGLLFVSELVSREVDLFCGSTGNSSLPQEVLQDLPEYIVTTIKANPLRTAYDDSDYVCRYAIFNYNKECNDFKTGAESLCNLNLDSTVKRYTVDEKCNILVTCAEAFMHEEANDSAELMCTKAGRMISDVENNVPLLLRYRVIRAKVDDANRKFVEAARQYHELSNTVVLNIPMDEKLQLLGYAVTCAVLGKAGPQRSRILGLLYKDDRLKDLATLPGYKSHASVLTKMYTERLLFADELKTFEESLSAHQRATTSEGWTIVEKAVIEHNMLAAKNVYDNITFSQLAAILRLDTHQAERVAAKMITEGRLVASIDQTEELLNFASDTMPLQSWDERIRDVCSLITDVTERITAKSPRLLSAMDVE